MNKIFLLKELFVNQYDNQLGTTVIGAFTSMEALNDYVLKNCEFYKEFNGFTKEGEIKKVKTNLLPPDSINYGDEYIFAITVESVFIIA